MKIGNLDSFEDNTATSSECLNCGDYFSPEDSEYEDYCSEECSEDTEETEEDESDEEVVEEPLSFVVQRRKRSKIAGAVFSLLVGLPVLFIIAGFLISLDLEGKTYAKFGWKNDVVKVEGVLEMRGDRIHRIANWISPELYKKYVIMPRVEKKLAEVGIEK